MAAIAVSFLLLAALFGLVWLAVFLYWFLKKHSLRPKKISDTVWLEKFKKERTSLNEGIRQMHIDVQAWGKGIFPPPIEKKPAPPPPIPPSPPSRVEVNIRTTDHLSMGLKKAKKRVRKFDKKRKKKKKR